MSQQARCPQSADLVLLLPAPAGPEQADLSRHVAVCPDCADEMRVLTSGFAALGQGGAQGPVADPHLLRRIEEALLPVVRADLLRQGAQAAPGLVRLLLSGVLSLLGVATAAGLWYVLRGTAVVAPLSGLALGLLPLFLLLSRRGPRSGQGLALGSALLLLTGLVVSGTGGRAVEVLHGVSCLSLFALGIVAPALVLRLALRDTGTGRGPLRGALSGLLLGACGVALQRTFCEASGLPHALLFHLSPVLLVVTGAACLGRWGTGQGLARPRHQTYI